jgi:hypothetical protein
MTNCIGLVKHPIASKRGDLVGTAYTFRTGCNPAPYAVRVGSTAREAWCWWAMPPFGIPGHVIFWETSKVRVLLPPPRFALTGYAWRSHDSPSPSQRAQGRGVAVCALCHCARHNRIVGSPSTVTEKIEKIYHDVGGFGTLLVFGFDYKHRPEAWHHSLSLLKNEVMPRLGHLIPDLVRAA